MATTTDNATFQYRLDAIRKEHTAKAMAAIARCAPIKERLQDFTAERKRIERATATLSQDKKKSLAGSVGEAMVSAVRCSCSRLKVTVLAFNATFGSN